MSQAMYTSSKLIDPDADEYEVEDIDKARVIALQLAVQHHGLASMNNRATPTSREQVITTADMFMNYIIGD